jgi:hypothetical protein
MIPKPPLRAISTAISYSVTVSILRLIIYGDDTIGILRGTFLENLEVKLICYRESTSL